MATFTNMKFKHFHARGDFREWNINPFFESRKKMIATVICMNDLKNTVVKLMCY